MTAKVRGCQVSAELWLVDLARSAPLLEQMQQELPRLGVAERAAILALKPAELRQRRWTAHVALRLLLERVAGSGVRGRDLERQAGGKPRLRGLAGEVEFSLSHADDLVLIAVARGCAIGVDLERVRAVAISPARRLGILRAAAALSPAPPAAAPADEAFMRAWVRLEAVAKASGDGLAHTLSALGLRAGGASASPAEVARLARSFLATKGLSVHDLALAEDAVAAVAIAALVGVPPVRAFPSDRAGITGLLREPPPWRVRGW
jgi:4'-phosphopantetheinyl transferase